MHLSLYTWVLFFFWICINNVQFAIILYFNKKNCLFYIIHFLILNFIFTNLLNLNMSLFIFEISNLFNNETAKFYRLSYTFDFFFIEVVTLTNKYFFFYSWKYLFSSSFFSYFLANNMFLTQLVINLQTNTQFFFFSEPYLSVILIISLLIGSQLTFYNLWKCKNKKLLQF